MNKLVQMKPMTPEDWIRVLLEPIDRVLDEEGTEYARGHNIWDKPLTLLLCELNGTWT